MYATPSYFDVHTHTQFAAFREDEDAVITRALDAGVWMVNVGTQKDTSAAAIAIAHRYPEGVYATIGLHPIHTEASYHDAKELGADDKGFTSRGEEFDYDHYRNLGKDASVVAIGECGLDYYRLGEETKDRQHHAFAQQIALAVELNKPLMIHCRNAFADLIRALRAAPALPDPRGIIHFFSGTREDAAALLDLGFSFSFGGVTTFADAYDEVVRFIPLERITLETDAPYVTPVPYRGKRNEPLYIMEVAKKIEALKRLEPQEMGMRTAENARRIFRI